MSLSESAAKTESLRLLKQAGIIVTKDETDRMEVTDFGLGMREQIGLQIIIYVNNDRYCAKELMLLPGQICPEHRHPPIDAGNPGKQETFRCRWGTCYLYIEGEPTANIRAKLPPGTENAFTARHEIVLQPGEQFTLAPNMLHWFQAGPEGAVISEFSSTSRDRFDIFTLPVNREAKDEALYKQ
jgi:D-lyxose ketol-isomerase